MVQNKALIFTEVLEDMPVVGKHLIVKPLAPFNEDEEPPAGGFNAKVITISLDPYLRHRMLPPAQAASIDFPPLPLHAPVVNTGIIRVLRSSHAEFKEGDSLIGFIPCQEYLSVSAKDSAQFTRISNPYSIDERHFFASLGGPGRTAYCGLFEIGKPKKGETIFVSAASGAVGQVVAEVAKRRGLRVIGSVGGEEKLTLLKRNLHFDEAFNYRATKPLDALKTLAPEGIDIYFDNVGGEQLEAAIEHMNVHGRIVACGFASQYSIPHEMRYGIRNSGLVVGRRLTWRGFTTVDPGFGADYYEEHVDNVQKWISDGTFTPIMNITRGIDKAAEALVSLFKGENMGKAVLDL